VLDRDALADLGVDAAMLAARRALDGDAAIAFLAALPGLVRRWQARFGLSGAQILSGGALSATFACTRAADGRAVVLKLAASPGPQARAEAAALAAWGGAGACPLFAVGEDGAALVLARIEPGTALTPSGDDAEDARSAAALLALLHAPRQAPGAEIPPAAGWLDWRFARARRWIAEGRAIAGVSDEELDAGAAAAARLDAGGSEALLHGDFLGKNILLDGAGRWWAIDPMPCRGDPCLDAGFWALHHRPGMGVQERCGLIARAAGLDAQRVWAWARAFAASEAAIDVAPGAAAGHLRTLRGR